MLATASQPGVRYAAMFISAFGLYISTCLNNLWAADNHAGHYKRAVVCSTIPMTGSECHWEERRAGDSLTLRHRRRCHRLCFHNRHRTAILQGVVLQHW
jgi:hypothetical protein